MNAHALGERGTWATAVPLDRSYGEKAVLCSHAHQ